MSKEIDLAEGIPNIIKFMEDNFKDEDGINKMTMLKTAATYYESVVTAESMRAMIIKSMGVIK